MKRKILAALVLTALSLPAFANMPGNAVSIEAIASAIHPSLENLTVNQHTSAFDHGGSWVGAQYIVKASNQDGLNIVICGKSFKTNPVDFHVSPGTVFMNNGVQFIRYQAWVDNCDTGYVLLPNNGGTFDYIFFN
ncbi:MAG: hypothetical protein NTV00_00180 [Methylococcales bacterium]|nr:hypothetical protein [Methylococcales bacterium]